MLSKIYLLLLYTTNWLVFADNHNIRKNDQDLVLCRKCGADIADSYYIIHKSSPGAKKTEKQNIFGRKNVTVQTLINAYGIKYDLITTEKARCENIGPSDTAESWFPGYTWRMCACPHCGQHLGWSFTRVSSKPKPSEHEADDIISFHALILNNVLGENFTDSLLVMPKSYKM